MASEYVAKCPCDWWNSWTASDGSNYLTCHVTADVTVSIDKDFTRAHCTLDNYAEEFTPGSAVGGGFVNIGGIAWNTGSFRRGVALANPATEDSFTRAWDELYTACPSLYQKMIVGVALDDKTSEYQTKKGSSWNSYDIPLYGDLNNARGLVIANSFVRYYDWEGDNDQSVCADSTAFNITVAPEGPLDFLYFPWAIRISDRWMSCDRDGGAFQVYSGGKWVDMKNSLTDDSKTKVFNYSDGWRKAMLIGDK